MKSLLAKSQPRATTTGLASSSLVAILISLLLGGAMLWGHQRQDAAIESLRLSSEEIRSATKDLAKGILCVELASHSSARVRRETGINLIDHAIQTLLKSADGSMEEGATADGDLARHLADFRKELLLAKDVAGPSLLEKYGEVEREAEELERLSLQNLEHEVERVQRSFDYSMVAAFLILGIICVVAVLTERVRGNALRRVRESGERLRFLGDNLPDGYLFEYQHESGAGPRFLYVSAGVERIHGIAAEEVMRDAHLLLGQMDPSQRPMFTQKQEESRQSLSDFDMDIVARRPDGTLKTLHARSRPSRRGDNVTRWVGMVVDVTDRKRAEQALRESEMRLQLAMEAGRLGLWEMDLVTQKTVWSPTTETIMGYGPGEFPGTTEAFFARIHPEHLAEIRAMGEQAMVSRTPFQLEYRVITLDGSVRWVCSRGQYTFDAVGHAVRLQGIVFDISERREAEKTLQEGLLFRREAEKIARVGAWKVNPSANYLYWTEGVYEIVEAPLDYKPGLEEGLRFYDPESIPVLRSALERALSDGTPFVLEMGLTTMKGRHLWTEVRGIGRVGEGAETYVMGTFQDITERKKAEAEVTRLAMAIEQAAEIFIITDLAGNIVYVNPAFERISGYAREEVIGCNPRILKSGRHDDGFYKGMWETLARGEVWQQRMTNRSKSGKTFEVDAVISPVRNSAGSITHYVAANRDMSREHELELQIRQAQKMEAVGRLAGGIAHDFNNILQAIFGFCDILHSGLPAGTPQHREVAEIQKAASHAAGLTRQLLAFSRRQLLSPTMLDLNVVLGSTRRILQRLLGEDIEIVMRLEPDLPRIKADPGNVEQVIMNLSVNARDAMPEGGKLSISTKSVYVNEQHAQEIPESRPGRFVCLSVTDTGSGMTDDVLQHIFEPFFSTKGPDKGTGLGLSVIYGIAKQHDGWVQVSTELGRGSEFRVFLPVSVDAPARTEPARIVETAAPPRGRGEKILLVEDEIVVRDLVQRVLEEAGYEVIMAAGATAARNIFDMSEGGYDMLFTDVVLTDGNGFQIAEEFRSRMPKLKVLLCSGYTDERARWAESQARGFHFIHKPYSANDVLRLVRRIFDR